MTTDFCDDMMDYDVLNFAYFKITIDYSEPLKNNQNMETPKTDKSVVQTFGLINILPTPIRIGGCAGVKPEGLKLL